MVEHNIGLHGRSTPAHQLVAVGPACLHGARPSILRTGSVAICTLLFHLLLELVVNRPRAPLHRARSIARLLRAFSDIPACRTDMPPRPGAPLKSSESSPSGERTTRISSRFGNISRQPGTAAWESSSYHNSAAPACLFALRLREPISILQPVRSLAARRAFWPLLIEATADRPNDDTAGLVVRLHGGIDNTEAGASAAETNCAHILVPLDDTDLLAVQPAGDGGVNSAPRVPTHAPIGSTFSS